MAVYSPADGILAQITEDRDACGVGFIASLSNTPSHSIVKQVIKKKYIFFYGFTLYSKGTNTFFTIGS